MYIDVQNNTIQYQGWDFMLRGKRIYVHGYYYQVYNAEYTDECKKYLTKSVLAKFLLSHREGFTSSDFVKFCKESYDVDFTTSQVRSFLLNPMNKQRYLLKRKIGKRNVYSANPNKKLDVIINSINGIW